jgi:uncharacterized protein YjbI with pentapeptide repeats
VEITTRPNGCGPASVQAMMGRRGTVTAWGRSLDEQRKRVVRRWLWALGGLVVALAIVFALVVGPWLFTRFPHQDLTAEQELKAKNDVRTTLVQALVGAAVAGGAVVTYRTYRHNRFEQDRTYEQNRIEQNRTYERELYAKAIEQLGHDHAPVRLGALYSLETLGQDRPHRRKMVVDVLCAYLRMPYAPPESADAPPDQERQVRLTAERLLSDHVCLPDGVSGEDAQHFAQSPDESFWPGISLDLTGAFLIDLNLRQASVVDARFDLATFSADRAQFEGATFTGDARFTGATFTGRAWFYEARFTRAAWFEGATLSGNAGFQEATFTLPAMFERARFTGDAFFSVATFTSWAFFNGARFASKALFDGATFTDDAVFTQATFTGEASFEDATLSKPARFDGAQVLNLDNPELSECRVWPNGWTVRANADDPTRGTLVHEPPASSLEPPDG